MTPRIETAVVLSFRLRVPPAALEELPEKLLAQRLRLQLQSEEGELVLGTEEGESCLRFRFAGEQAVLTEIALRQDPRGSFFQCVLGPLMVRFGGDLRIRLVWNTPERNSHGEFAEVRISRGSTTYPGLADGLSALPPASGEVAELAVEGEAPAVEPHRSELDQAVEELLSRARSHWEEYQRLKAAREKR